MTISGSTEQAIDSQIRRKIAELKKNPEGTQSDRPFLIADTSQTLHQHQRWKRCLPNIQPFYAVKCNSDVHLLRFMAKLGLSFDCASWAEIQLVLGLGVDPSRIIFAHPCKAKSALKKASEHGVLRTTFDNLDELDKIKAVSPGMELFLRIFAQDETASVLLGSKFGAPLDTTKALLARAQELGLKVVGISFHIGSGASDPNAFVTAVRDAKQVFEQAENLGFSIQVLDVGGGFQDSNLEQMALPLRLAIAHEFPSHIQVIAEPGRYYARSFYTMVCKVISRRTQPGPALFSERDMLYQNDGIYGCFLNVITENEIFIPTLIPHDRDLPSDRKYGTHHYSIWGPTCDGMDCILKEVTLGCEVKVGDWLKYKNMGAYTVVSSSEFNGFSNRYEIIYLHHELPSGGEAMETEETRAQPMLVL